MRSPFLGGFAGVVVRADFVRLPDSPAALALPAFPERLSTCLDAAKSNSVVEAAGVQDRLRVGLTAEHDEQVADKCGAALVIEFDDVAFAQVV